MVAEGHPFCDGGVQAPVEIPVWPRPCHRGLWQRDRTGRTGRGRQHNGSQHHDVWNEVSCGTTSDFDANATVT